MKLEKLSIRRMPGITEPFHFECGPGLNVIVGPNGIGKSSAMTALRAILWPEIVKPETVDVEARWRDGTKAIVAELHTRGEPRWQCDGAPVARPPFPVGRFSGCFFPTLHDLLVPSGDDELLGKEIARQLAGGYDVGAVLKKPAWELKKRHDAQAGDLRGAQQEVLRLRKEQEQLATDEAGLRDLRTRLEEARTARDRRTILERAQHRVLAMERVARADRDLTTFPSGLDAIQEDGPRRLDALDAQVAKEKQNLDAVARELADAERALDRIGLDAEVPAAVLLASRSDAEKAKSIEAAIGTADRELAGTRAELDRLSHALGGFRPRTMPDALPGIDEVERLVLQGLAIGSEERRIAQERAALAGDPPTPEEPARRAAALLREWLAAPVPGGSTGPGRAVVFALAGSLAVLAVISLLAGAVLAVAVHVAWAALGFAGLVGILVAAGGGALGMREGPSGVDPRPEIERRYAGLGAPLPASWERTAIEAHVASLDAAVARAMDGRARSERARGLEAAASDARSAREAHDRRVREVRANVGIDAANELGLAGIVGLLHQLRGTEGRAARQGGEREALAVEQRGRLEAYRERLRNWRVDASSADAALTAVTDLERRSVAWTAQMGRRSDLERRRDEATGRARQARHDADTILQDAGCTDVRALRDRVVVLDGWRAAVDECKAARGALREHDLALVGQADVLELDAAGLADAVTAGEELAAQADELHKSITEIETRVGLARSARTLEDALVARTEAMDRLERRREEMLAAGAGKALLELVRDRYETSSRPEVLQGAMDSFAAFTHHQWRLAVDRDGAFRAVETATGTGRSLVQLSEGTRAQLLLAVRLAFASRAQAGAPVPLVLDEALSNSDPARFDAVVASLAALVETEGRQVFYLTSQPMDAARWKARAGSAAEGMRLVDLGEIRRQQVAASEGELIVDEAPGVPSPEGLSGPAYAASLRVPPFRPQLGADGQHVYYLLEDTLPELRRILQLGLRTVGAVRSLLGSRAAEGLSPDVRLLLERRVRWLDAFSDAWSEGRGRPVGREQLVAAGVPVGFLDSAMEVADRLKGDPRSLLVAMRSGEVRRLRTATMDQLESWLRTEGYLDARPVLSSDGVRLRVIGAARDLDQEGPDIAVWVQRWTSWAGGREASAGPAHHLVS